ncbi:butyrophilin-like protein 10 [Micropterus dolomieu]|uniref:butyrophilin-like protein 10 n=1 Tax=Micropterus dolomieu TaxID=147949 RepID=UPI001E8D6FD3|nr:butyrophilin-like protein 10 [Micropterus dolomieu]
MGDQSQMIVQPQPIMATVGDDITLPCHVKPATDAFSEMLEWSRADLNPRFVHVRRFGEDHLVDQNPAFKGRTSVSIDGLKHGETSLKLSKVKLSDEGTYKCFIPGLNTESSVQLVVGSVSSPEINISTVSKGVMLDCKSKGWYPEPEVFWLDGEGNLLSAGPTETVRGPDDLYTVSSRVTVEKRHSNSFTCRVQQKDINQTRETHIQVTDDFFEVQSSSLSTIIGLAVSLAACILLMSAATVFFVYKRRQNTVKTKTSCCDEIDEEGRNNSKGEQQQLMTDQNREGEKIKHVVHGENQTIEIFIFILLCY